MRIAFCCDSDFNLGVAYVIAYLKNIGHEVRLFLRKNKSPMGDIVKFNPDLVCFSCVTANVGWAIQEAKHIKENLNIKILFGGVHPTLCPEDITKEGFDVCVGDGIKYFGGEFQPDMLYPDRESFLKQLSPVHRAYQIFMTGFGCPFRCSYCNSPQLHRKIIKRSVEGCIDELEHLKQGGLRYVLFVDDIFILDREWILSFLGLYRNCIRLPFTCFAHTNLVSPDIIQSLKESYCEAVWLGIQTGNEEARKMLNRYETNRQIYEACRIIKENKLKLIIDHIFGLPNDTYERLEESYFFYKSLKPDVVDCNELLYFPKAEINKYGSSNARYEKEGGQDYRRYAKSFQSLPLRYN